MDDFRRLARLAGLSDAWHSQCRACSGPLTFDRKTIVEWNYQDEVRFYDIGYQYEERGTWRARCPRCHEEYRGDILVQRPMQPLPGAAGVKDGPGRVLLPERSDGAAARLRRENGRLVITLISGGVSGAIGAISGGFFKDIGSDLYKLLKRTLAPPPDKRRLDTPVYELILLTPLSSGLVEITIAFEYADLEVLIASSVGREMLEAFVETALGGKDRVAALRLKRAVVRIEASPPRMCLVSADDWQDQSLIQPGARYSEHDLSPREAKE